ncbi:Fic family protein [Ramlibacter sp.]|uniref:Fic family protein n=1 Tax=Ramlibacter sp. TaxID=1917967 RepID=UPI002D505C55|nr:Fic family protein [Ramlibacter sp.]HYD75078.1 Fic family protein [Ramlibacter sp.]
MPDTELKLKFWRGDQIGAERLSATILHIEGFSAVDPQCPLGGPDGLKDVLCEKNNWKYVAAAYFPTGEKLFRETKAKFVHDLKGVQDNSVDGIVFLTNQSLTPGERDLLGEEANALGHKSIIYHLERIRALLDSPSGYGARLEYLDIDMSREEQLSFFSQWNRSFADMLQAQSLLIIREIGKRLDSLGDVAEGLGSKLHKVSQTQSLLVNLAAPSDKTGSVPVVSGFSLEDLSVSGICMLHRALLFDAPPGTQVGLLRTRKVWLGGPGTTAATATFVPPDPEQVPALLEDLLSTWRNSLKTVAAGTINEKIAAMTRFHHRFVSIHPFLDGNGRIARFLLAHQARELLHQTRRVVIEDRLPYFDALAAADKGDYAPLEAEITQAIMGVEFMPGSPCQMSGQRCPACGEGVMDVSPGEHAVMCNVCGLEIPAPPHDPG